MRSKGSASRSKGKGDLDGALKAFRELENTDTRGLKELGMYHQARILFAKGDTDKPTELLKGARERLKGTASASSPGPLGESHPFQFFEARSTICSGASIRPPSRPPPARTGQRQRDNARATAAASRAVIESTSKGVRSAARSGGVALRRLLGVVAAAFGPAPGVSRFSRGQVPSCRCGSTTRTAP